MTATRPHWRFSIFRRSTRLRLKQRSCRKVAVVAATDDDVTEQSNKNSVVDAGFCGEPFADNGELLKSLSPLLFNMKIFGLFFNREDRHRRPTDDLEWNNRTKICRSKSKLQIHATVALILIWINALRMTAVFNRDDHFGAKLLIKTTYYLASHSGQLLKILLTLPVTRECVRGVYRAAVTLMIFNWIFLLTAICFGAYFIVQGNIIYDYMLAPFFTQIRIPEDKISLARGVGFLGITLVFTSVFFAHSMTLVLVYIFYSQFKALKKNFRRAIGENGEFNGDLSAFRRRHQILSRAVKKVDGFMQLSNVAGFVCHIANTIIILYTMIFYTEATKDGFSALTYLFWLILNVCGLLFSASAGITVNHMAHKLYDTVHDIDLTTMNAKTVGEVNVFLNRLHGEPIGFSVLEIFVIDKNTILSILGLLITYFLLVVQFANPYKGSTSSNETNSISGLNSTTGS